MLSQLVRYSPIIQLIRKYKPKKIVEVGSGDYGIGKFSSVPFLGIDLDFKHKGPSSMKQIKGNACKIPLKDNFADFVFSLDMLEHLSPNKREKAIIEIYRVTNKLAVFGFPCGNEAQKVNKILKLFYQYTFKPIPDWLLEHLKMGFPETGEIEKILKKNKLKFKRLGNGNIFIYSAILFLESLSLFHQLSRFLSKKPKVKKSSFFNLINFGKTYRQIYVIKKTKT